MEEKTVCLAELPHGIHGRLSRLLGKAANDPRLPAIGLWLGQSVRILRGGAWGAFLIAVGDMRLAIDRRLAREIYIDVDGGNADLEGRGPAAAARLSRAA